MQRNKFWDFLGNTILLTWSTLGLVIFMYFPGAIGHLQGIVISDFSSLPYKISNISMVALLFDALTSFLGMAFFGISCTSLGLRLANLFHLDGSLNKNASQRMSVFLPTCFLVGNAVFSLVFLTLASLSNLTKIHSIVFLSLGLLSGLTKFKNLSLPTVKFNDGFGRIVTALSLAILAISLFQSSARISFDSSAIYFSNAKLTALDQQVEYFTKDSFVVSAFHAIIQYSAVMQVFGDQSARMVSWLFGLVNIALALALADVVGASLSARRVLPALILTSTAFLDLMGDGKVDLFSSAYSLAAVYWMAVKVEDQRQERFIHLLSGFFIGFACILRPHNAFLLGIFVLVFFVQKIRTGQSLIPQSARYMAWMALGAVGLALYHFFINQVILGSPFAFWSSVTSINPTEGPWDFNPETIWISRLLYPFVITFKNSGASLGNITPLMLAFVPLLAVRDIRTRINLHKDLLKITLCAGLTLLAWITLFFTIVEVRYVMFLWIILFIPMAEIIAAVFAAENSLVRTMGRFWVVLLMGFILARSAYISISAYSPMDGNNDPQCSDNVLCNHFTPINETAEKGERVLTLSAFRYYMRTDLFACSTTAQEYYTLQALSHEDADLFWREVQRMGFSYLAFEEDYATRHLGFSESPFSNLPEWIQLSPMLVSSRSLNIAAYRIDVIDPPVHSEVLCTQEGSGIWHFER